MPDWVPSRGFTVGPVAAGTDTPPTPEFIRLPKPGARCPYCGLTRSHLYTLCQEGKIESIVLRKRGRQRGVRLIAFDSLIGYLRQLREEQNTKRRR